MHQPVHSSPTKRPPPRTVLVPRRLRHHTPTGEALAQLARPTPSPSSPHSVREIVWPALCDRWPHVRTHRTSICVTLPYGSAYAPPKHRPLRGPSASGGLFSTAPLTQTLVWTFPLPTRRLQRRFFSRLQYKQRPSYPLCRGQMGVPCGHFTPTAGGKVAPAQWRPPPDPVSLSLSARGAKPSPQ